MLDLTTPPSSTAVGSVPPPSGSVGIDDRSDAELDSLGFGVIALDAEGTILRYNLYESRFARLDRNQVLGRNFFQEVARCTQTPEFEGRFRTIVDAPAGAAVRFDYLFDFKFGAQRVDVEIVSVLPGAAGRFYLLINRRQVEGPRPDFPAEKLAVEQRALAPDEKERGVLRDDIERRFVDVPAAFFGALRATCDRLAPETWGVFANEWGVQWGRRAAVDLEASAIELGAESLRDLPMREVAKILAGYFGDRGWGLPAFEFNAIADGLVVVRLDRSALAEAARSTRGAVDRSCHLVAGCLAGVLSAVAGRRLAGREVACRSGGAPSCELVVFGHERRTTVDAVLATGARGVDPVRSALRKSPRGAGGTA
jgi:photoactive yellow protein